MKKSIILIILMSTLLSHNTIEAKSSCKKEVCNPKPKRKHKNRKIGSCNKDNSCGKKNVRLDRFVPWKCDTGCN